MTSTGNGSAYWPMTSNPLASVSASRSAASSLTRGRSRSTWPRLKAPATSRRMRVCSGGSFSIIWWRCSRLNGASSSAGSRSFQIRPNRRSRSTALVVAWSKVRNICDGSCQATGCAARSSAKNG